MPVSTLQLYIDYLLEKFYGIDAQQVARDTGNALSQLANSQAAAANHASAIVVWSAAGHTITTGTMPFTPSANGSGKVRVMGTAVIDSAALNDDVSMILWIDGAAVAGAPTVQQTGGPIGAVMELSVSWDVTLTIAAHTIALQASSGTPANLTGVLGVVQAQELV
jgi:hypothetical protein